MDRFLVDRFELDPLLGDTQSEDNIVGIPAYTVSDSHTASDSCRLHPFTPHDLFFECMKIMHVMKY